MTGHPRVSMVMITWNQARFVREAVEALFAQDYPNLEIVLSDHGSSDGTFDILAAAAAGYGGPHRVVLRRSDSRGGILGHFLDAVGAADGELMVMVAGDDVSLPHRASALAACWQETGAAILHSATEAIDAQSRPLPLVPSGARFHDVGHYFPAGGIRHMHGASAAYDRKALLAVPAPPFPVFTEDLYLTLMLGARCARQAYVETPLLRVRLHPAAYTSRGGHSATLEACEQAICDRSRQTAAIFRYALETLDADAGAEFAYGSPAPVDRARLRADAAFHEAIAGWYAGGPLRRLLSLRFARRSARLRWMLPRLFGLEGLRLLKSLRRFRSAAA